MLGRCPWLLYDRPEAVALISPAYRRILPGLMACDKNVFSYLIEGRTMEARLACIDIALERLRCG